MSKLDTRLDDAEQDLREIESRELYTLPQARQGLLNAVRCIRSKESELINRSMNQSMRNLLFATSHPVNTDS